VMTAHVRFPALDSEPATVSAGLIGLLRSELGFTGLVMTDALEMRAITGTVGLEEGAVRALAAGADALCLGADRTPSEVEAVLAAIVEAVRAGRLPEERLREAVTRVAELASWASSPRPQRDREAGVEAARRALRVEGDTALGGDPLVVELWPEPTIAAGEAHHGLGGLLGAQTVRLDEGQSLPAHDSGRPLVIVLRDAHRHPWQRELVPSGSVVVETGLPEWRPEAARGFVATYGAGRANLEAAADLLGAR
jgi:beta-N-acetylhexosaminidase